MTENLKIDQVSILDRMEIHAQLPKNLLPMQELWRPNHTR
jgi:hypothetical protein